MFIKKSSIISPIMALWFALITYPLLLVENRLAYITRYAEISIIKYQIAGFIISTIIIFCLNIQGIRKSPFLLNKRIEYLLFNLGILLTLCLSIFSINPILSAFYVLIFYVVILNMSSLWYISDYYKLWKLIFFVLIFFIISLFVLYGSPEQRFFGGVHPNHAGAIGSTTIIFGYLLGGWYKVLGTILGMLLVIIVNSRYSILTSLLFCSGVFISSEKRTNNIFTFFSITIIFILLISSVFDSLFKISDEARGLSSGIGGRYELLLAGVEKIKSKPLTGWGFRTRGALDSEEGGTHNAYINLILEVGIIAGSFFIFGLFMICYKVFVYIRRSNLEPEWRRILIICNVGIISILIGIIFQPIIFNVGDVFGLIIPYLISIPYYKIPQTTPP